MKYERAESTDLSQRSPGWRLQWGANLTPDGVHFRVWAPNVAAMAVKLSGPATARYPMERGDGGVFECVVKGIGAGTEYLYELDGTKERPDPVSRFQPHGVHGPSQVVDPGAFKWEDQKWSGLPLENYVIYELHVGTFTPEGTFDGLIERLDYLRAMGVTAVELMPVAQFPGTRNWGYDGVCLYAPQASYGGPEGLKRLVNECHRRGLAIVLDVVYNHLGPEGNYLADYGPYFTDKYKTPWGTAINYDDRQCDKVRQFFIDNALYWLTEYHVDALRLDAIHGIFDFSARHFLAQLSDAFHREARRLGRQAWLIAESDLNDVRVLRPERKGGYQIDAQWSDDFHHALHAVLTGAHHGYFADFGRLSHLAKALSEGFVYDGCYSVYRQRRHGSPSSDRPGTQFVVFAQNHDQVANGSGGKRSSILLSPAAQRVAAAILMCAPAIPLLFMGQEFAAMSPFLYFTNFPDEALGKAVAEGRRREFEAFPIHEDFIDPQSAEAFEKSRLDWAQMERPEGQNLLALYRDLAALRSQYPMLGSDYKELTRVYFDEAARWLVLERRAAAGGRALLVVNFAREPRAPAVPASIGGWGLLLHTEDPRYGGSAPEALTLQVQGGTVNLPPQSAALLIEENR